MSLTQFKSLYKPKAKQCINGCGTPPNADESHNKSINKSKVLWDLQTDEDEEEDRVQHYAYQNITPNIKSYSFQMPSQPSHGPYFYDKVFY